MQDYFEANGLQYDYEQYTYCLLPAFDFRSYIPVDGKRFSPRVREITYTPDFVGKDWIIETKGMKTPDFLLKWKMFKKYCLDNNMPHTLYMPSNQKEVRLVIEDLLSKIEAKCLTKN